MLFEPYVRFHLLSYVWVTDYWEIAAHSAYDMFFSSPEPSGLQGELIVYPCSVVRPSVVRPSSTIFKDLLL